MESRARVDVSRFFDELVRLEIDVWNAADARLRSEQDVPLQLFEVMRVIDRIPGCRVNDIAGDLSITVGGASKVVDRIEGAGWCARRKHPTDRRSSVVVLTRQGKALLRRSTAVFLSSLEEQVVTVMPAAELKQLIVSLTKLRAGIAARSGHAS